MPSGDERLDPSDAMMMILGVQNEISGATRFVKYLFLADKSKTLGKPLDGVEWKPHYYGPYWDGFDDAAESLERQNLLKITELRSPLGNTMTKFTITPKGRQHFSTLTVSQNVDDLVYLLREHQKKPLISLLNFVYEQYPDYAHNSVIKDQVINE